MSRVRTRAAVAGTRGFRVGRRTAVVGTGAVAVAAVGLVVATSNASAASYRSATATRGSVEQTVSYDGTIAAANRSDLVFATEGTVKRVKVRPGEKVEAGQTLATLETRALRTAVIKARADLADAKAYLDDVEDGQIDTVTRAAGGASPSSAPASSSDGAVRLAAYTFTTAASVGAASPASTPSADLEAKLAELGKEQDAVKTAQSTATEAIATAKDALARQKTACAGEGATGEGATGASAPEEEDGGSSASAGLSTACQQALQHVQDAQDVVADAQDALQVALETLGSTLDEAVAQLEKESAGSGSGDTGGESQPDTGTRADDGTKPDPGTSRDGGKGNGPSQGAPGNGAVPGQSVPQQSPSQQSAPGGSGTPGTPGGASTTEATATDLASAQADVDAKKASLAQAEADLAAASLTAPFDGTVMAVDVSAGDAVSATDRVLVLIGDGDTTATLSVPVDDLSAVEVGQSATVTPGVGDPVAGKVTKIGLLPEVSGTGSGTTYGVTVRIDGALSSPEGSIVSVALVTATSADVVTVPTTAVTRLSDAAGTVLVIGADGEATRTRVTLGAVSGSKTAVTDGLDEGQKVVIADLGASLPGSSAAGSGSGRGARGGFPGGGAGFPSGGFPAGGTGFRTGGSGAPR